MIHLHPRALFDRAVVEVGGAFGGGAGGVAEVAPDHVALAVVADVGERDVAQHGVARRIETAVGGVVVAADVAARDERGAADAQRAADRDRRDVEDGAAIDVNGRALVDRRAGEPAAMHHQSRAFGDFAARNDRAVIDHRRIGIELPIDLPVAGAGLQTVLIGAVVDVVVARARHRRAGLDGELALVDPRVVVQRRHAGTADGQLAARIEDRVVHLAARADHGDAAVVEPGVGHFDVGLAVVAARQRRAARSDDGLGRRGEARAVGVGDDVELGAGRDRGVAQRPVGELQLRPFFDRDVFAVTDLICVDPAQPTEDRLLGPGIGGENGGQRDVFEQTAARNVEARRRELAVDVVAAADDAAVDDAARDVQLPARTDRDVVDRAARNAQITVRADADVVGDAARPDGGGAARIDRHAVGGAAVVDLEPAAVVHGGVVRGVADLEVAARTDGDVLDRRVFEGVQGRGGDALAADGDLVAVGFAQQPDVAARRDLSARNDRRFPRVDAVADRRFAADDRVGDRDPRAGADAVRAAEVGQDTVRDLPGDRGPLIVERSLGDVGVPSLDDRAARLGLAGKFDRRAGFGGEVFQYRAVGRVQRRARVDGPVDERAARRDGDDVAALGDEPGTGDSAGNDDLRHFAAPIFTGYVCSSASKNRHVRRRGTIRPYAYT